VPSEGTDLTGRWVAELVELGFTPPTFPVPLEGTPIGALHRDAVSTLALIRLAQRRSAWNLADIRGEVERIIASVDVAA